MISQQALTAAVPTSPMETCRWPADAFYWAVLDAPMRRPGQLSPGFLLDLQDQVPVDAEQLHAVGISMKSSDASRTARTLVCAVPRGALGVLPPSVTHLAPSEGPAGFEDVIGLSDLNLLVGEFEPPARRGRRARRHVAGMVGVIVIASLVSWGFARRTGAVNRELAVHAGFARTRALSPADVALLRAFATRANAEPVPSDAAAALSAVLRSWPSAANGPGTDVQSLTVDGSGVALTVSVSADPGEFLAAVRPPPGYVLDEPGIGTTSEGKARLALTFRRFERSPQP